MGASRYSPEYKKLGSKIRSYERMLSDPSTSDMDRRRINDRIALLEAQQRSLTNKGSIPDQLEYTVPGETTTVTQEVQRETITPEPKRNINLLTRNLPSSRQYSILQDQALISKYEPQRQTVVRLSNPRETRTIAETNTQLFNPSEAAELRLAAKESEQVSVVKGIESSYATTAAPPSVLGTYFGTQGKLFVSGVGRGALFGINPIEQFTAAKSIITKPRESFLVAQKGFQYNPAGFLGELAGASATSKGVGAFVKFPFKSTTKINTVEAFKTKSTTLDFGGNTLDYFKGRPTILSNTMTTRGGGVFSVSKTLSFAGRKIYSSDKYYKVTLKEGGIGQVLSTSKSGLYTSGRLTVQRFGYGVRSNTPRNVGKPYNVRFKTTNYLTATSDSKAFFESLGQFTAKNNRFSRLSKGTIIFTNEGSTFSGVSKDFKGTQALPSTKRSIGGRSILLAEKGSGEGTKSLYANILGGRSGNRNLISIENKPLIFKRVSTTDNTILELKTTSKTPIVSSIAKTEVKNIVKTVSLNTKVFNVYKLKSATKLKSVVSLRQSTNNLLKQNTSLKQNNLLRQSPINKQSPLLKTSIINKQVQVPIVRQSTLLRQSSQLKQSPILKTSNVLKSNMFPKTVVSLPPVSPPLKMKFNFGASNNAVVGKSLRTTRRLKYGYSPSVEAVVFNIKGLSMPKGYKSGLIMRPII